MARRKSSSGGGSLDSLLDTLTNVVGILIIIMVLMQVSVGESVKRMQGIDGPLLELTDDDIKKAEQEAVEVSSRLKELLEATASLNLAVEQRALTEKQRSLAQLEKNLASLLGKINLEEVRKQLEEVQKKETALEKEVLSTQEQIAKIKAQLASTPEPQGVAATIVTLPDPRPAPEKAKPAIFLVRKGRVVPVEDQRLKGIVNNVIGAYVDKKTKRIDAEKALKVFNNQKRSTYGLNLSLKNLGENIYLVVTPDDDAGEAGDKVDGSTSTFRRLVRRINPQQNYVRFLVWADSFADYLAARAVAEEYGLLAGWEAYVPDQEYRIWIGQTTAYKPPPKPTTPARPTLPNEQVD